MRLDLPGNIPAPEFPPLEWLNTDRPLSMRELRGKVVLLDFWTYGCINCIHIIPQLKRLEQKYRDELVVIGVHSAKFANEAETENIRRIIMRYELEHPVVNDRDFVLWRRFGARAWPTLALIDPEGNIVASHSGERVYEAFDKLIRQLVEDFEARGRIDRRPLRLKLEGEGLPEAFLSFPGKVLADAQSNSLYIADTNHNRLLIANLRSYEVKERVGGGEPGFADGDFDSALFNHPQGMTLSDDGRTLYVADTGNHALRAVDLLARKVETIAGTGQQTPIYPGVFGKGWEVSLNSPWDVLIIGGDLYIAMAGSHQIWRMDLESGEIAPWAGSGLEGIDDGTLGSASLAQPSGLTTDDKRLFFADSESSAIRMVDLDVGFVRTLVGTGLFDFGDRDGVGRQALLQHALGIDYSPVEGLLYIADTYNSKVKRVDPETGRVETLAGGGHGWRDGKEPLFYEPGGLSVAEGKLYVADTNNHAVRVMDIATGDTYTVALRDPLGLLVQAEEYEGPELLLGRQDLAAGRGIIKVDVRLPEGYFFNEDAPSSLVLDGNTLVTFPTGTRAGMTVSRPSFPQEIAVVFNPGRGFLDVDLTVYYCREDIPGACFIERAHMKAPVRIGQATQRTLELTHVVRGERG